MEQIARRSPSCWHCKIDESNRGEPLCLCKCGNKFIHVYCLKERANTLNILNCLFCGARYPLERRPKSLLMMLQKVWKRYFMMLFSIFPIFLSHKIGLITYSVLLEVLDPLYVQFFLIVKIIAQGTFFWYICMTVPKIVDWSNRTFEPFREWYKSTYEWKLIRPSTVNNIEEYNIEE